MKPTKKTTIILFSGDYDKAMAAYIIANGAAAYDHDVTIFHTFWGLNALRKDRKVKVKKGFLEKLFANLMPRGAKRMGLSKMNFAGFGPQMIKHVIKKHQAMTLPEFNPNGSRTGGQTGSMYDDDGIAWFQRRRVIGKHRVCRGGRLFGRSRKRKCELVYLTKRKRERSVWT